ncbi:MAG: excisionase [Janthinobacterium lividum]
MNNHTRWVLIKRIAEITGYTENAVRHKIKDGTWLEGRLWRKAPDGRVFVDTHEFDRWVESASHPTSH